MIILITITSIFALILLAQLVWFSIYIIKKMIKKKNEMIVFADVPNTISEEIPIFIIDNIRDEEFRNAKTSDILFYGTGKHIQGVAFRSKDLPNGVRVALTGIMDSSITVIHAMGATKNNLWEVSFDGGVTRQPLTQISNTKHTGAALSYAQEQGWEVTSSREKITEDAINRFQKSRIGDISLRDMNHRLLAGFNEKLATDSTLRFQLVVPREEIALTLAGSSEEPNVNFYYVYRGMMYKFDSKFHSRHGNLYEWEFYNLEPNKSYVGISFELNNNGILIPSSTIYGSTKKANGSIPTFDESELGNPKDNVESKPMWSKNIIDSYLGEKVSKIMYDSIVKKHYEEDQPNEYLAITQASTVYEDYEWLTKGSLDAKQEANTIELIRKLQNNNNTDKVD